MPERAVTRRPSVSSSSSKVSSRVATTRSAIISIASSRGSSSHSVPWGGR